MDLSFSEMVLIAISTKGIFQYNIICSYTESQISHLRLLEQMLLLLGIKAGKITIKTQIYNSNQK